MADRSGQSGRGGFAGLVGGLRRLIAAAWRQEPGRLLAVLAIVAGMWVFVEVADEVIEGEHQRLDERILVALRRPGDPSRPIGPAWLADAMRDVTALGSGTVLLMTTLAVSGFLLLAGYRRRSLFVLLAAAGGVGVSVLLKELFARPRPDVVPHLAIVHTHSFPSGHSMLSAVVYLSLGVVVATAVSSRRLRAYVLLLALLMTALVGLSRMVLGVHYPTDVLAGWSAGLAWALLCWLAVHALAR